LERRVSVEGVTVKELLECGTHFGHRTTRWNPKMKCYIFGERNGIHIIDLDQTVRLANMAYKRVADMVALGSNVLFVGTKPQAQEVIRAEAERVGMYYVNNRWLGGMLTNFKTIKQSIDRLNEFYQKRDSGELDKLPKKEVLSITRKMQKLEANLGGIRNMTSIPDIVYVVDPHKEKTAVEEAKRLGLVTIALTDTNCDPTGIDFVIPGNDDAISSITRITKLIADACQEGLERRQTIIRRDVEEKERSSAPARAIEKKPTSRARAFVARETREADEDKEATLTDSTVN